MERNVLLRIHEMDNEFTPIEKKIAVYVSDNPDSIASLSIHELAQKSMTSDASVIRFCHSLGYSGYREFIVALSLDRGEKSGVKSDQSTDICPGDSIETILDNTFFNSEKALRDTRKLMNLGSINKAVDLLCKSKQIHFFGIGASGLVCLDAVQKFMRINKVCFAHTESYDQTTSAALMDKNDVGVLVTYSGRTRDIVDIYDILCNKKIPMIVITKLQKNGLISEADVVINVSSPEITMRSGAMGSRIAMLAVVDLLFSSVASKQYNKVSKYLIETHNVIESHKR